MHSICKRVLAFDDKGMTIYFKRLTRQKISITLDYQLTENIVHHNESEHPTRFSAKQSKSVAIMHCLRSLNDTIYKNFLTDINIMLVK